jgi:hypothetical protein
MRLIPIQPKGLEAAFKRLPDAVHKGLRAAAEGVKSDMELTVKGWEHPAEFTADEQADGSIIVGTDDPIWKMTDEGTPPHVIVPRNGKALAFNVGGRPKTTPGRLASGGGSKGGIVVIRPRVNHPGTKPRRFTELIMKRWKRGVQPFIRAAIEEVLNK